MIKSIINKQILLRSIMDIEKSVFESIMLKILDDFRKSMELPQVNPLNYIFTDVCRTILDKLKIELNKIAN